MSNLSRRDWLSSASTAALAALAASPAARALEPLVRRGPPRLRLSLAAYSFRDFFRDQPGPGAAKDPGAKAMDMLGFLDYCAAQGCDGAELTSYYFPHDLTPAYLLGVRRHAFLRGVSVSGTAVGNTFTLPPGERRDREIALVKRWIDFAQTLGAPHIRVFAGNLEGQSLEVARRNCIAALEECGEAAAKAGIFLGIENHGGIVAEADDLLAIVKAVKNPWIGVNLDTGNFHSADPYADLVRCAPYAVNVQIKVEMMRRGAAAAEPAQLDRLAAILRDAGYQGWVALEYEAKEDPYTAVPRHLKALAAVFRDAGAGR